MTEIEHRTAMTRAWLESWIELNQKPDWLDWLGLYPAKASVHAARCQLTAMNYGVDITIEDCVGIFEHDRG